MDRDKLFTVMLGATLVFTLLFSGLVFADLSRSNSGTTLAGLPQGQDVGPSATAAPGATPTATPGARGAQANTSSTVQHGATAGNGANPTVAATHGIQGHTILLGSIITQTGPGRSIPMAHAITAWVNSVNQKGGINGYKFNLDLRDDAGNADTGSSEYHAFAQDEKVFAMLGECAPITDAQMVSYVNNEKGALILVGECQSADSAYSSPYIWVTGPTPRQNGELGAKMMMSVKGWPNSGGKIALVCLDETSTQPVCDGAANYYGKNALWNGAPQEEQITDNNYSQLISQWCSAGVGYVHLVLEPGSTTRYLSAAQNSQCNGQAWNPPTFMGLVIDDGIAGNYANANGMMIDTPWTPLDQTGTPGMQRLINTLQTYYPDDKVDLYAQTGWSSCLLLEQAMNQMGGNVGSQQLVDTLNAIHNWNTGIGPIENYTPQNHVGQVESSLEQLRNAGTSNWQLYGIHGEITL